MKIPDTDGLETSGRVPPAESTSGWIPISGGRFIDPAGAVPKDPAAARDYLNRRAGENHGPVNVIQADGTEKDIPLAAALKGLTADLRHPGFLVATFPTYTRTGNPIGHVEAVIRWPGQNVPETAAPVTARPATRMPAPGKRNIDRWKKIFGPDYWPKAVTALEAVGLTPDNLAGALPEDETASDKFAALAEQGPENLLTMLNINPRAVMEFLRRDPQTIGPYRIVRRIGEGGMGIIFEAINSDGRHVALKVARTSSLGLSSPVSSQPDDIYINTILEREGETMTVLAKDPAIRPSLPEIYARGHTEDGRSYIAIELLTHQPLDDYIKKLGSLSPGKRMVRAAQIVRQTAKIVAAIHRQGIMLCDITPGNIMVKETAFGVDIRLIDLGLAKNSTDPREEYLQGTPLYMAPEQRAGTGSESFPIDVYPLGLILYELAIGNSLKKEMSPASFHQLVQSSTLPNELKTVILQATVTDPSARATAQDLQRSLGLWFQIRLRLPDWLRAALSNPFEKDLKIDATLRLKMAQLNDAMDALETDRGNLVTDLGGEDSQGHANEGHAGITENSAPSNNPVIENRTPFRFPRRLRWLSFLFPFVLPAQTTNSLGHPGNSLTGDLLTYLHKDPTLFLHGLTGLFIVLGLVAFALALRQALRRQEIGDILDIRQQANLDVDQFLLLVRAALMEELGGEDVAVRCQKVRDVLRELQTKGIDVQQFLLLAGTAALDPKNDVRIAAIQAMGALGLKDSRKLLERLAEDTRKPEVARAAHDALESLAGRPAVWRKESRMPPEIMRRTGDVVSRVRNLPQQILTNGVDLAHSTVKQVQKRMDHPAHIQASIAGQLRRADAPNDRLVAQGLVDDLSHDKIDPEFLTLLTGDIDSEETENAIKRFLDQAENPVEAAKILRRAIAPYLDEGRKIAEDAHVHGDLIETAFFLDVLETELNHDSLREGRTLLTMAYAALNDPAFKANFEANSEGTRSQLLETCVKDVVYAQQSGGPLNRTDMIRLLSTVLALSNNSRQADVTPPTGRSFTNQLRLRDVGTVAVGLSGMAGIAVARLPAEVLKSFGAWIHATVDPVMPAIFILAFVLVSAIWVGWAPLKKWWAGRALRSRLEKNLPAIAAADRTAEPGASAYTPTTPLVAGADETRLKLSAGFASQA
jgi:serine/threonine protein kinase/HEAT repeat protein